MCLAPHLLLYMLPHSGALVGILLSAATNILPAELIEARLCTAQWSDCLSVDKSGISKEVPSTELTQGVALTANVYVIEM